MSPARLVEIFSSVPEHRHARTRVHVLVEILVMALLAIINGAQGWEDMADFAEARKLWLRTFLKLPGGAPCADTFRRCFEALDTKAFVRCMQEITADLSADLKGRCVAIDGKTLRGSFDRRRGLSPLHIVSAWVGELNITLGQIVTEEKSNEITAIPELLKVIDVKGATVTIDAMGCQKKIATAIIDGGADYALALKDNHPTLRAEVEVAFQDRSEAGFEKAKVDVCEVESKEQGPWPAGSAAC